VRVTNWIMVANRSSESSFSHLQVNQNKSYSRRQVWGNWAVAALDSKMGLADRGTNHPHRAITDYAKDGELRPCLAA